jgi:hypothetical protein
MRLATLTYRARGALLFTLSTGALLVLPGLARARAVHPCVKGWCQHGVIHAQSSSLFGLAIAAMFVAVAVAVLAVECHKDMGEATAAPRVRRRALRRRAHTQRAPRSLPVTRQPH